MASKEKIDPTKIKNDDDKNKIIKSTLDKLQKDYGEGIIRTLTEQDKVDVPHIPTGAITLDIAIGIGGVPRGRVVEIYGPESSGKTTLTLSIISQAQKAGGICSIIDVEHALDPSYAKILGVDLEKLYVSQPDSGDQALEILETLVRSCTMDVIVVDSVAALVPQSEIDGQMGDAVMGAQARLMSQALRKLTPLVNRSQTCVIFINQIRHKIGTMFGSPETTAGGNALKFYSSLRLDIRKTENLKKGENFYGSHVKVKIVKNKVAPPFKVAEFDIYYAKGINKETCLLDAAVQYEVIKRSGTWFSYGEERIGQGKENASNWLAENVKIMNDVEKQVIEKAFSDFVIKETIKEKKDGKNNNDDTDDETISEDNDDAIDAPEKPEKTTKSKSKK